MGIYIAKTIKIGYACIINDHRGHGKSIRNQEDLGYFYDNKAESVVEDLHQITEYFKERFKNKKIILFGHSMGSMIVRKYIAKYDDKIDGLYIKWIGKYCKINDRYI